MHLRPSVVCNSFCGRTAIPTTARYRAEGYLILYARHYLLNTVIYQWSLECDRSLGRWFLLQLCLTIVVQTVGDSIVQAYCYTR